MMLYLSGAPVFTIMKLGRWLSDSFLDYIEQQVLTFSKGMSTKMLFSNTFFNFPVKNHQQKKGHNDSEQVTRPHRSSILGQHSSLRELHRP